MSSLIVDRRDGEGQGAELRNQKTTSRDTQYMTGIKVKNGDCLLVMENIHDGWLKVQVSPGQEGFIQAQHMAVCTSAGCGKPTSSGKSGGTCGTCPTCIMPGCTSATWNGQPGEKCRKSCIGVVAGSAICVTPNCGKPTWNGQAGEKCSKSCGGAICITPGCGKSTWNGLPGQKCRKKCGSVLLVDGGGGMLPGVAPATCITPGCGKPTYNGKAGEKCAKKCGSNAICVTPGCGKPTYNGKAGEKCAKKCGAPYVAATPPGAPGSLPTLHDDGSPPICGCGSGKPTWNGKAGETCDRACSGPIAGLRLQPDGPPTFSKLDASGDEFASVSGQFASQWDPTNSASVSQPQVKEVWKVTNPAVWNAHAYYCNKIGKCPLKKGATGERNATNPGNRRRWFHGTTAMCLFGGSPCGKPTCIQCSILTAGFQMQFCGSKLFFGKGLYYTSTSSGSCRYARNPNGNRNIVSGVCIMCVVACGKGQVLDGKDLTDPSEYMDAGLAPGFDSRIVENPGHSQVYKDHENQHGKPCVQCDNEIIVFNDAAVLPSYLITFTSTVARQ